MYIRAFLLAAFLATLPGCLGNPQRKWDGLRVKWDRTPGPGAFDALPRNESEAVSQGFRKVSDCSLQSMFRGKRYVKDDDYAVVLLYDINGYIAGIQTGVPKGQANGYPFQSLQPPFIEEGDHFFMTAYFMPPAKICREGRSAQEVQEQGTGSGLYLKTGSDPLRTARVPRLESELRAYWEQGKCFPTMGVHYWHGLSLEVDCHFILPVFLLYNGGELTGFGWAFLTDLTSPRWEHPTAQALSYFAKEVPRCLPSMGTISTMHIFLTNDPRLNTC